MSRIQKELAGTVWDIPTVSRDKSEDLHISSLILSALPRKMFKRLFRRAIKKYYGR